MRTLTAPALTVRSPVRERVYSALLAADHGCGWTVRQMAEIMSANVSAHAVRATLYLLLGDNVLQLVGRQRTLTLRLSADGATILKEILAIWRTSDPLDASPHSRRNGDVQ